MISAVMMRFYSAKAHLQVKLRSPINCPATLPQLSAARPPAWHRIFAAQPIAQRPDLGTYWDHLLHSRLLDDWHFVAVHPMTIVLPYCAHVPLEFLPSDFWVEKIGRRLKNMINGADKRDRRRAAQGKLAERCTLVPLMGSSPSHPLELMVVSGRSWLALSALGYAELVRTSGGFSPSLVWMLSNA
jgi:hypothetical protein